MAETDVTTGHDPGAASAGPVGGQAGAGGEHGGAKPTVVCKDVDITYRVYEDRRQSLRSLVASKFKSRESRAIEAVKDVSFTAYAGDAIGVIGSNGSGKSTLLRAIGGLMPVTDGEILVRGSAALLGVGAALQPKVSGRRNVLLGGLALGLSREEVAERFDEIVEFAGLEHAIDLPLKTYSSGMRARLQFAISSAVRPEVLLIDEALAVGDKAFKVRSQQRIDELRAAAGTIFLVSHSMGVIKKTCTRALWLEQGVLRADGDPKEVVAAYDAAT